MEAYFVARCPGFKFVFFLLGQPQDGKKNQENKRSNINCLPTRPIIQDLRYVFPILACLLFIVDITDWWLNGAKATYGQQNNLIVTLAFLQSQSVFALTALASLIFITGSREILLSCNELMELKNTLAISAYKKPVIATCSVLRRKRYRFAVALLISIIFLRLLISALWFPYINVFWQPTPYFVFMSYRGCVFLFLRIMQIICRIILVPQYLIFVFMCAAATDCALLMNRCLQEMLNIVHFDCELPTAAFDILLMALAKKERSLNAAIGQMDHAFSSFVAAIFCANSVTLLSSISRWFILLSAPDIPTLQHVAQGLHLIDPVMPLVALVMVAVMLEDTKADSVKLWKEILTLREATYRMDPMDPSEKILLLIYKPKLRSQSLTFAGMAPLSRGFGVTLIAAFGGAMCFLWDRNEQFQAAQLVFNGSYSAYY